MQLFVVPRSIPIVFAMLFLLRASVLTAENLSRKTIRSELAEDADQDRRRRRRARRPRRGAGRRARGGGAGAPRARRPRATRSRRAARRPRRGRGSTPRRDRDRRGRSRRRTGRRRGSRRSGSRRRVTSSQAATVTPPAKRVAAAASAGSTSVSSERCRTRLSRTAKTIVAASAKPSPIHFTCSGRPRSRTSRIPPATIRSAPAITPAFAGSSSRISAIATEKSGAVPTVTDVRDGPGVAHREGEEELRARPVRARRRAGTARSRRDRPRRPRRRAT